MAKILKFSVRGTCPEPSPIAVIDSTRHVASRRGVPRSSIDAMIDSPEFGDTPADAAVGPTAPEK